jgi:hypothetical protein
MTEQTEDVSILFLIQLQAMVEDIGRPSMITVRCITRTAQEHLAISSRVSDKLLAIEQS